MASGIPMVATDTTISGSNSASSAAQLPPGGVGEAHPVVDADEQGDGQVVREGHQREIEGLGSDRGPVGAGDVHGRDSRRRPHRFANEGDRAPG